MSLVDIFLGDIQIGRILGRCKPNFYGFQVLFDSIQSVAVLAVTGAISAPSGAASLTLCEESVWQLD